MTPRLRLLRWAVLLAMVAVAASCNIVSPGNPSPTVCNGISSEVGGCDPGRHEFTSSTCQDLAKEWATVLDAAVVKILDGPEAVAEQGRSVRLRQALVITTGDMNIRMQALSLQAACDLPEFMGAAEPVFSGALRAGVGNALYDGAPTATYGEWLDDVRSVARSIDDGE